jgi:DNA-binding beta-propeller fold protein YncE
VTTQIIRGDRLVSQQSLGEWDGEFCPFPASGSHAGVASLQQAASARVSQESAPSGAVVLRHAALRVLRDRYPSFAAIAVDPMRNEVVVTDENLFQIMFFNRMENNTADQVAQPVRVIGASWDASMLKREEAKTRIEFQSGVYIEPGTGNVYAVNNDTEDHLTVFSRDARGNVPPNRAIHTPHGTFGIAVDESSQEMFLTLEHHSAVVTYKKGASGEDAPIRLLQGDRTRLADPHGIAFDPRGGLIFVANHGSASTHEGSSPEAVALRVKRPTWPFERNLWVPGTGRKVTPSITVYSTTSSGDTAPVRVIEGSRTRLNWPTGIALDSGRGELYVANDAGESILVFDATAAGDVAPRRVLAGARTGLKNPTGVALDLQNGELWVANFGNHTATAYPLAAQGDVAPLRTIRKAPRGTPSLMIGNPGAIAYDTRREQILVPN